MKDAIDVRVVQQGDPAFEEMAAMVEFYRATCAAAFPEAGQDQLAIQMTSACVFAGTIFGSLLVAGLVGEGDKRRAAEMAAKNFREGIEIGRRRALRVAAQMPVGGIA